MKIKYCSRGGTHILFSINVYADLVATDHYCMVFETLGVSLYDLVKKNDYKRLPMAYVRDIARQLLQALDFLRSINLIHTGIRSLRNLNALTIIILS